MKEEIQAQTQPTQGWIGSCRYKSTVPRQTRKDNIEEKKTIKRRRKINHYLVKESAIRLANHTTCLKSI